MPSIRQPHPSTRQPLPPRPDPEALLLEAIQRRDAEQTRRLVSWWVHRRGLEALLSLVVRSPSPAEGAETLAWIEAVTGSALQPATALAAPPLKAATPAAAPLNRPAEGLAHAPSSPDAPPEAPPEPRPSPRQLADQAVAAVDAAIAQLMAEFPAEALAGLPPRQALEVLDGLEGSPALAGLALVAPPADLLRDPDFQSQPTSVPARPELSRPVVAAAWDGGHAAEEDDALRSATMAAPLPFSGPLSFTIPQPDPATASPGCAAAEPEMAPGEDELIEEIDAGAAADRQDASPTGSTPESGGSLIAPLRGRLGVRRLARRLIERVKEVGLGGSEGGLAASATEPRMDQAAGPAAIGLEEQREPDLNAFAFQHTEAPVGMPAPRAMLPSDTAAANAGEARGEALTTLVFAPTAFAPKAFETTALEATASADDTAGARSADGDVAMESAAIGPWPPALQTSPFGAGPAPEGAPSAAAASEATAGQAPASGAATIVSLGERLRQRTQRRPGPDGEGAPAPRPAALADLGAWLPSAELPRAS